MIILCLLVLVLVLSIQYAIARAFEAIAFQKGYTPDQHTFAMCFWLGPAGWIYVLALPDLVAQSQRESIIHLLDPNSEKTDNEDDNG